MCNEKLTPDNVYIDTRAPQLTFCTKHVHCVEDYIETVANHKYSTQTIKSTKCIEDARTKAGVITHANCEGIKHDETKVPLDLLPFDALEEVAKVLNFGATKYGRRNWEKGMAWSRLLAATLRHLFAWSMRKGPDEETNLSHLAHAACCVLFLLSYEIRYIGNDDRHE